MTPAALGPYHLFEVVGIEIEYVIVDRETLAVRPIADELIRAQAGRLESEIEVGAISWSNELVLHLVELKTNGPSRTYAGLADAFQQSVRRANELLAPMGAALMPSGMHPWMDPASETRLWPHEYAAVYQTFHRIFDCRRHGWANVQSTHVNLPFADDEEFGRLHAAVRLSLPVLPALAASSPLFDGRPSGLLDSRMDFYRSNARTVPSVGGCVIPEREYTRSDYERNILQPIHRDLAPHDPDGILRGEWVNARGCIARFDRGAIEIRVLDTGECPRADLAISTALESLLRGLVDERFGSYESQRLWSTSALYEVLCDVVREGEKAILRDERYLRALGFPGRAPCLAGDLWRDVVERDGFTGGEEERQALDVILTEGCLARRILDSVGPEPSRERIDEVYRALVCCLAEGRLFRRHV